MRILRSSRLILLALLLSLVPASSFAGVYISVGFAPPVLPVYEQPPCPEPGWLWTPGYWAYGDDGYYWVPGSWVPAPYVGALWTPPYWGWSSGLYVFHPGYWGQHVGYYGGVNYGFGYMGIGFVGGAWHGHDFAYNTAVVRVNNVRIHNVYVDRTVVRNYTVVNDRRVAYSGGPGGIRHDPRPEERVAMHDRHEAPTVYQQEHIQAARADRNLYVKNNGGRPQTLAVERPMGTDRHAGPDNARPSANAPNVHQGDNRPESRPAPGVQTHQSMQHGTASNIPNEQQRNTNQGRVEQQSRPEARPAPQHQQVPETRPQQQPRQMPESRPTPETRQAQQYHPAPQERSQQQSRPMPESHPAPQHQQVPEARPQQQSRPMPESRPAPHPQQQSRPMPESHPMPQHNAPETHQAPQQNHKPDQKPH
jgi:hypothetical protein